MSLEDWQRGVKAGMGMEVDPIVRDLNREWHSACLEIVARCVARDMYPQAMEMLHQARLAAEAGLDMEKQPRPKKRRSWIGH